MMLDMASNTPPDGHFGLPDPTVARDERDKGLALEFVRRGEPKGGALALSKATGVNYRTVYRAIERWLLWARAELAIERGPGADSTSTP